MEQLPAEPIWQVDVGGQIYDASFSELGSWIGEGSLLPQDKVRKGNLRWIEAQKVPGLTPFFNAKAKGEPMPLSVTETIADTPEILVATAESESESDVPIPPGHQATITVDTNHCSLHPEIDSFYVCETCCNGFCKTCPSSYGGSVKICPMCGAMCKPIVEARASAQKVASTLSTVEDGFGVADFVSALAHPFKFKTSLLFGAVMFAFVSIGQSASGMGGMMLFAASIVSLMLANMLTFGVLANTIDNFVQGRLEANFMPEFGDFNIWDDVVEPFFLSVAAYIVSFGPFLVMVMIGIYLVTSSTASQMQTFQSEIEKLPGTQYYTGRETVEQSQQVKKVLGDVAEKHDDTISQLNESAIGNVNAVPPTAVDEDLEMWNQLQESRKRELEAAFGKTAETRDKEFSGMVAGILNLAAPIVVIGAIALLWGLFFYPVACAVAGYTRSFVATINPLVGFDTIKRMGSDYAKLLTMSLALSAVWLSAGAIFALIFSPFDLPGLGNIPAKIFTSIIAFYLFAVFSCVLGYVLHKNAHKLGLAR